MKLYELIVNGSATLRNPERDHNQRLYLTYIVAGEPSEIYPLEGGDLIGKVRCTETQVNVSGLCVEKQEFVLFHSLREMKKLQLTDRTGNLLGFLEIAYVANL